MAGVRGGERALNSGNGGVAARTAEDPSRTGRPGKAVDPTAEPHPGAIPDATEYAPRTALQMEMMKRGGPYSPSLYSATAPLRQAQKNVVDDLRMRQVIARTEILEGLLANDKNDLDRYESSRESFKADWEARERRMREAMNAAKQNMILAGEEIPLTERDARAAKGYVLARERDQRDAKNILADADQTMIDAQDQMQRAAMAENEAGAEARSAKESLDSAKKDEKDAQNKYDSARERWLPHSGRLNRAESMRDEAVRNRILAENRRNVALARQERARAAQGDAKMQMGSVRDAGREVQDRPDDAEHKMELARRYKERAEMAEREAEIAETEAKKQMLGYDAKIRSAEAEIAEVEGPERETRQIMDSAEAVLRKAKSRASKAEAGLSRARRTWERTKKEMASARKALNDAKEAHEESKTKADVAKESVESAKTRLQQAQRNMPSAEVQGSARRDLDVAAKDWESAKRRYDMAGRYMTAADKKEKSAGLLRAAEEARLKDGAERWNAEGGALTALEQIKDKEAWAQERFVSAKRMREAGKGLRAARMQRAESVRKDAEYSAKLAKRWLSQDRATLDDAKERHKVATRWLNDAEKEGWPRGGDRWPAADQKALDGEQGAAKNKRALMDQWAEERTQWVKRTRDDAGGWDAFAEARKAEEAEAASVRAQDARDVRDAGGVFNLILESLERVPEPGRTEANIDIYRNGVEAAKPHRAAQEGGVSSGEKYRNCFARDHPEVERRISSGQISGAALGALDAVLANMHSERTNISRDGEVGVTPSVDRRTAFREGTLALAGRHLVLYDGLKELERIPLDSIKKCSAGGWLSPALSIELAGGKKKFCLPAGFAAGHSESDEYEIWRYLIESRKAGGSGTLRVNTVPPGAVVLVNGTPCGITPLSLEKPIMGGPAQKKYTVSVLLEGHARKSKVVDRGCSEVGEKMERLKKADPLIDMAAQGYRRQVPGGSATELYVTEHALNGENGTSLVLSRNSVIVLSGSGRVLLDVPYGALEGVETYSEWFQVWGLKVKYRQAGGPAVVKFAANKAARSACGEIKSRLKEKMNEWRGREPGSASDTTRLPRPGYTLSNGALGSPHKIEGRKNAL